MKERRRSKRIAVQRSFSFFSVIPSVLGISRIYMKDVSKHGLCLTPELPDSFHKEQRLDIRVYAGPLLYLPIRGTVVRKLNQDVGVEFDDPECEAVQALTKFLEFLEIASKVGVMQK